MELEELHEFTQFIISNLYEDELLGTDYCLGLVVTMLMQLTLGLTYYTAYFGIDIIATVCSFGTRLMKN